MEKFYLAFLILDTSVACLIITERIIYLGIHSFLHNFTVLLVIIDLNSFFYHVVSHSH